MATYRDGVFSPQQPVQLPEGSQVTIWLEPGAVELQHLRPDDREFLDDLARKRQAVFEQLAR